MKDTINGWLEPCIHAVPQAASCLHGVCVFCYRNRLAAAHREIAKLREDALVSDEERDEI